MAIDEKQLRASGIYLAKLPLSAILQDFEQIGNAFARITAHRRALRKRSGYSILAAVLLMAIGAICRNPDSNAPDWTRWLLPFGVPVFLGGFAWFVQSFFYGRKLVDNKQRYDLANSLLSLLRQDTAPQAPYSVRLTFAPRPTLLKESPFPQRKNGKQRFYSETWLTIDGRLLDGTAINQDVTELMRKRTFVNPRGKSKTKTRSRFMLALQFEYPGKVYGDARGAREAMAEEPRLPHSARLRSVRVTEKTISMKALANEKQDIVQSSAMLWLGAYRILNLARRTREIKK